MKQLLVFFLVSLFGPALGQSPLFVCDSQPEVIRFELPQELLQPHFHCKGEMLCPQCAWRDSTYRAIANELNNFTIIGYDIIVHSDLRGSADFNDSLTEQQALDIFLQLKKHGVDSPGVAICGKGERDPLIPEAVINQYKNDHRTYEALHRQNRRFELHVILHDPESVRKRMGRE